MSSSRKCDICGNHFDTEEEIRRGLLYIKAWKYYEDDYNKHDVCVKCYRDIKSLISNRTCKNLLDSEGTFVCSRCGAHVRSVDRIGYSYLDENGKRWYSTSNDHGLKFCPNCGLRVINDE